MDRADNFLIHILRYLLVGEPRVVVFCLQGPGARAEQCGGVASDAVGHDVEGGLPLGAGHAVQSLEQPAGEYGLQNLEVDRRVMSEVGGPSANTRPRAAPSSWWVVVRRVRDEFTVAQPRSTTICCLIVSQETTSFLSPARGCATSDSGVAQRAGPEWIGKAAYLNAHTRPSFSSPRGREGGRANFCNMYSLPYRGWAVGVICALSLFVPYLLGLFFFWGGGLLSSVI